MVQVSYRYSYGKVLKNEWIQVDLPLCTSGNALKCEIANNISVNNSIEKLYHKSFVYEFADTDACQTKPCYNEGRCFDRFEGYICACLEGFEGVNCQLGEDTNSISLRAISMYNCYCVFHLLHDQNILKI